jgi:hypothetical protein
MIILYTVFSFVIDPERIRAMATFCNSGTQNSHIKAQNTDVVKYLKYDDGMPRLAGMYSDVNSNSSWANIPLFMISSRAFTRTPPECKIGFNRHLRRIPSIPLWWAQYFWRIRLARNWQIFFSKIG